MITIPAKTVPIGKRKPMYHSLTSFAIASMSLLVSAAAKAMLGRKNKRPKMNLYGLRKIAFILRAILSLPKESREVLDKLEQYKLVQAVNLLIAFTRSS